MRYSPHYTGQVLGAGGQVGGGPGEQREAGKVHAGGAALLAQLCGLRGVVVAEHIGAPQEEDATCWEWDITVLYMDEILLTVIHDC